MSLSEAAVYVKKLLRYSWIAVVGIVVIWLVVLGGINFIPSLFDGGLKADIAFGVIPKPTIPQNVTSKGLNFVLDTVDGKFPQLPNLLAVYQTAPITADILGPLRSGELSNSFSLPDGPAVLDSQTYRFTDNRFADQSITINVATENFVISSNNSKGIFNGPAPSNADQDLIDSARSLLQVHGLLPDELSGSRAKVTHYKETSDGPVLADSIESANYSRVDIFRKDVNGYQIVGPFLDQALIYMGLKNLDSSVRSVVEMHYTFWPYLSNKKGLYPLLPVDKAFSALQNGEGSLISPNVANFKDVSINKISIGYYQDDNFEPYLEPIYLFDGTGTDATGNGVNVRFYLPAVDPQYLK